ncbi:MAG TPA: OsmC family protein [Thermoanaerobaculia bacterium]|nr:OsmC family protein [Thermoanaerobaculia bacterium]
MAETDIRRYDVQAQSTETFGRVLCGCRNHHFAVDGPVQNGCPGEAVTPAEFFLAGIAACGVELIEVIAREMDVPLQSVRVAVSGAMDRSKPVRPDVNLFTSVRLEFDLAGVTSEQGTDLVTAFERR